jgi:hypothetical protein
MIQQETLPHGRYEEFLDSLDLNKVLSAQQTFWRLPLNDISPTEVEHHIYMSLCGEERLRLVLPQRFEPVGASTRIFRARTVKSSQGEGQILDFCASAATYLPPPPAKATEGRLNAEGEPVFYGSFQTYPLIDELGIEPGESFCIGAYEVISEQRFLHLVPNFIMDSLTPELGVKARIQLGFLERVLSVPKGKSSKNAYRLAHHLAGTYFNLNHFKSAGWLYPSAFGAGQLNVAFPAEKTSALLRLTHSCLVEAEPSGLRRRGVIPRALFRHSADGESSTFVEPEDAAIGEFLSVYGGARVPIDSKSKTGGT